MFGLQELFTLVFVLFALSSFAVLLILRYNRKRIAHKGELIQKDTEKDIAIKQTAFDTQEAERKRIGEDLHDDIGPKLGIVKMQLEMVGMKHPEVKSAIQPVVTELRDTMKHVRKVSHDLVPQILYEMGLTTSLKHISKQVNDMQGLSSTATISDQLGDMNKKKELVIYRIVQESVNNALKHASASRIDIDLSIIDGVINVSVKDDGIGIVESSTTGLGLTSMKDRAATFNGSVDIQSAAENGTEVLLNLPI